MKHQSHYQTSYTAFMPFWPILQTTYFLTSVFFYCKNTRNFSYKTFVSILCIFRLRDSCAKKCFFRYKNFVQKCRHKKNPSCKAERIFLVGVAGLEPAASWSRTKHTTKLCHTPIALLLYRMAERLSRFGSDFCRIFSKKRSRAQCPLHFLLFLLLAAGVRPPEKRSFFRLR